MGEDERDADIGVTWRQTGGKEMMKKMAIGISQPAGMLLRV